MRNPKSFLPIIFSICGPLLGQEVKLVPYKWIGFGSPIATLKVPPGFKEQSWDFDYDARTFLIYPDGSSIALFRVFKFKIPPIEGPDFEVSKTMTTKSWLIRLGTMKLGALAWREDKWIDKIKAEVTIRFLNVPIANRALFEQSLDSLFYYE